MEDEIVYPNCDANTVKYDYRLDIEYAKAYHKKLENWLYTSRDCFQKRVKNVRMNEVQKADLESTHKQRNRVIVELLRVEAKIASYTPHEIFKH